MHDENARNEALREAVKTADLFGSVETRERIARMEQVGRFFSIDNATLYVRNSGGEPLHVGSKAFAAVVGRELGMSRGDRGFKAVLDAIAEHAHLNGLPAQLEYVTGRGKDGCPLVHLGAGNVFRLTCSKGPAIANGTDAIVFQTERDFLAISPADIKSRLLPEPERFPALHEAILDHLPSIRGLLSRREAQSLLLATWLAPFLRPWATARPITLLVGPPGCGKTTTQRLFVAGFYGPEGEVGGGASLDRLSKDLLAGAVYQSLVVRDDVTDLPPGAMDMLCRTATGTKAKLAAFHETLSLVSYRTRAQLLLSAVAPSWLSRGDLMSRLWIIEFGAISEPTTVTERHRVEHVLAARPGIWAETLHALRMLAGPLPLRTAISRFDSFEQAVLPILERAGYGPAFENTLRKMPEIAANVAARSEPMLGYMLAVAHAAEGQWLTAAQLADELARLLGIELRNKELHRASSLVRDPVRLGQFLGKIEREGSAVLTVKSRMGHNHQHLWCLMPKVSGGDGGDDLGLISSPIEEERKGTEGAVRVATTPPSPPTTDLFGP